MLTTIHVLNGLQAIPIKKQIDVETKVSKSLETRFKDEKLLTVHTP